MVLLSSSVVQSEVKMPPISSSRIYWILSSEPLHIGCLVGLLHLAKAIASLVSLGFNLEFNVAGAIQNQVQGFIAHMARKKNIAVLF